MPTIPLSAFGLGAPPATPAPAVPAQPVSVPVNVAPAVRPANLGKLPVPAAVPAAAPPAPAHTVAGAQHLTLEEARQRVLANSKLLKLAAMNIQGKEFATNAVRADYFPQLLANVNYFNFNQPLGNVLAFSGRTVGGGTAQVSTPGLQIQTQGGRTLVDIEPRTLGITAPTATVPPRVINYAVLSQNSYTGTIMVAQPITALLKIRQGVKIARADEHIAQAQLEQGARALSLGVDQLYWGLLAAHRLRDGVAAALAGAGQAAKLGLLPAKIALIEARQGLQQVDAQIADLEQQLNALLDQPLCIRLDVVEPPFPPPPVRCGDDAAALAVQVSPEVREAQENIAKATAAVAAAKVDYLPQVAVVGGYANQTVMDYVQPNIGYFGVTGTWTLFNGGKRKNTVREREMLIGMASLKVRQVEDEVRQKAVKAFTDFDQTRAALALAEEKAKLTKEAGKEAKKPADVFAAAKAAMEAEVDLVKADLAHRMAYVKLMSLIGKL
jgi:outer membrane protein TolC